MSDAAKAIRLPKPMPAWQASCYRIALPFCMIAVVMGAIGLFILTDQEKASWISKTRYGEFWRDVIQWNPMTNGVCFNGGLIGCIVSFTALRRHRQGQLLQKVKIVDAAEVEKLRQGDRKGKKKK